jgi:hypothetical protein
MSTTTPQPMWTYLGSLRPGETQLLVQGHWMEPTEVDDLPAEPEVGTLVSHLQDPATGLRWVMLWA